jgi:hypothetical protein
VPEQFGVRQKQKTHPPELHLAVGFETVFGSRRPYCSVTPVVTCQTTLCATEHNNKAEG